MVELASTVQSTSHFDAAAAAAGDSAHVCQGLAVDARLTLEIVDRDVAVIPRQPGSDAETLGQLDHALLGKPCLGGGAVFPQVDTSGPAIAVKVIFSDQALGGEAAVDGRRRGSTLDRLFLG